MDEGFGGDLVGICHDRLSEAHRSRLRYLQAALQASPSLAWSCTQYAISDGGVAATVGCSGGFAVAGTGAYLWHAEAWGVWNIFCNFVSWNETNNFF